MNSYIQIYSREEGDRLGANILSYICQIIYAYHFNYYIYFDELRYNDSIFIKSIKNYINKYNVGKYKSDSKINICDNVNIAFVLHAQVVKVINEDVFFFFKNNLKQFFIKNLIENSIFNNYTIPYDVNKTILIHLRLDDLNSYNSFDYDGLLQGEYVSNALETNPDAFNNFNSFSGQYHLDYYNKQLKKNKKMLSLKQIPPIYGQSIIDEKKINNIIEILKINNPGHEIIIITSNDSKHNLEYRTICSDDPSLDLFFLCNCNKLVLSRSTYALSSLFFSSANEIWVPYNSMTASLGLKSKYDNSKFNYFY
jgi:hypothetical protein